MFLHEASSGNVLILPTLRRFRCLDSTWLPRLRPKLALQATKARSLQLLPPHALCCRNRFVSRREDEISETIVKILAACLARSSIQLRTSDLVSRAADNH